jgi:hypothetical protein
MQIIEALREWETGINMTLRSGEVTIASMSRHENLHLKIHTRILEYRERYRHGWHSFSQRVRSCAIAFIGPGIGDGTAELLPELVVIGSI